MTKKLKIGFGCDHGGINLKNKLIEILKKDYDVEDYGTYSADSVDYPIYAKKVAEAVVSGNVDKGIICCGSGIGVSIAANKVKGIRAVVCSDTTSARYSRLHNDANILCLGERIVGLLTAEDICRIWLETDFEGGRHQRRVDMLNEM
ncbi:ribose 5-phosphate isomerase B [bacterium]|nr:ribose 5-phosphate isomerase B [bacterium]